MVVADVTTVRDLLKATNDRNLWPELFMTCRHGEACCPGNTCAWSALLIRANLKDGGNSMTRRRIVTCILATLTTWGLGSMPARAEEATVPMVAPSALRLSPVPEEARRLPNEPSATHQVPATAASPPGLGTVSPLNGAPMIGTPTIGRSLPYPKTAQPDFMDETSTPISLIGATAAEDEPTRVIASTYDADHESEAVAGAPAPKSNRVDATTGKRTPNKTVTKSKAKTPMAAKAATTADGSDESAPASTHATAIKTKSVVKVAAKTPSTVPQKTAAVAKTVRTATAKQVVADAVGEEALPDATAAEAEREAASPPPVFQPAPAAAACACSSTECTTGCRGATWIVGSEAVFLFPSLNTSSTEYFLTDLATDESVAFDSGDIDQLFVTPRIWVGVQGNCFGLVGRYWRLSGSERDFDPLWVPSGDDIETGVMAMNRLDAYTADLEVTKAGSFCNTKLNWSMGVRYASIEQDTALQVLATVDDNWLVGTARSDRYAYGTGLTGGVESRTPLFCNSCAQLFWRLRGSVLWGDSYSEVETSSTMTDPTGNAFAVNGALLNDPTTMFIGEAAMGVEWNYALKWLPAAAFFRVAAEYQYWDASEGNTFAESFAGAVGEAEGISVADAGGIAMDLVGFSVGTGITW